MKKIFNETQKHQLKVFFTRTLSVVMLVATLVAGIFIGYYSREFKTKSDNIKETVLQKEIRIAVDSEDKLIIMNRATGHYTIYSDSIGKTVFHMYAKKIVE